LQISKKEKKISQREQENNTRPDLREITKFFMKKKTKKKFQKVV
jgi:hypothetical protein